MLCELASYLPGGHGLQTRGQRRDGNGGVHLDQQMNMIRLAIEFDQPAAPLRAECINMALYGREHCRTQARMTIFRHEDEMHVERIGRVPGCAERFFLHE